MAWLNKLLAVLAAVSCGNTPLTTAFPSSNSISDSVIVGNDSVDPFVDFPRVIKARQGGSDGPQLRILPLGASIMSGQGSPEHSG